MCSCESVCVRRARAAVGRACSVHCEGVGGADSARPQRLWCGGGSSLRGSVLHIHTVGRGRGALPHTALLSQTSQHHSVTTTLSWARERVRGRPTPPALASSSEVTVPQLTGQQLPLLLTPAEATGPPEATGPSAATGQLGGGQRALLAILCSKGLQEHREQGEEQEAAQEEPGGRAQPCSRCPARWLPRPLVQVQLVLVGV